MVSCHVSRKIETAKPVQKGINTSDVYEQVLKNEPTFKSMDMNKITINININGQSFSVKGFLKLIPDSVILISIQPFAGVEMARAKITPDSITVLDRFNTQYYSMSTDSIKEITGISFDFKTIQSLLSNQLFVSGIANKNMSKKMFDASAFPNGYELKLTEQTALFNQDLIINPQLRIEKSTIIDKVKPYSLTCEYSNFTKEDADNEFPYTLKFIYFNGKKSQNNIEISITKIEFDKSMNINFSIPEKYTKGSIENFKF
jgi:hypothetical protein